MSEELEVRQSTSIFCPSNLDDAFKIAKSLQDAGLLPEQYRGEENQGNILIAMEMAQRIDASLMAVMQNTNIIAGKPSWSSQFIISMINSSKRFTPLKFKIESEEKVKKIHREWSYKKKNTTTWINKSEDIQLLNISCFAYAKELSTGETITGPKVSLEMAFLEGWYTRNGSKWKTMPQMMLQYRAASFFGRFNCPEMLLGMQSDDEVQDVQAVGGEYLTVETIKSSTASDLNDDLDKEIVTPNEKIDPEAEKKKRIANESKDKKEAEKLQQTEDAQTKEGPPLTVVQTSEEIPPEANVEPDLDMSDAMNEPEDESPV